MKEVNYYYLKYENGQPYGCVAFRENEDGTVNRGVSLCSETDSFKKMIGRGLALKRLLEAEKNKQSVEWGVYDGDWNTCPTKIDEADKLLDDCKIAYRVAPTAKEHRILYKPETF